MSRPGAGGVVLAVLLAAAPPAAGQEPADAFERARADYVPVEDDPRVLAAMAASASAAARLARFHAVLDSVVSAGPGYPNALQYWSALALQAGAPPEAVSAELEEYLATAPTDLAAVVAFARVLQSHGAADAAARLIDGAEERGTAPEALALPRAALEEARGDPLGALEGYAAAIRTGGTTAVAAAAALERLLDRWPVGPPPEAAVERLQSARVDADATSAGLLIPLVVRARIARTEWGAAVAAAGDTTLPLEVRGQQLRAVATAAGPTDPAAAAAALDALLALGPPAARDEDRLRRAGLAAAAGDHAEAIAALRSAEAAGVDGADAAARLAEVAAARDAGDAEALGAALERAAAAGVDAPELHVPRGDLWLARGAADSALGAYASAVGEASTGDPALEALARVRLVQALMAARVERGVVSAIGEALVAAPAGPAAAAERLAELAAAAGAGESGRAARGLLLGLAGEWRGRAGDPAGASALLEAAAAPPTPPGETPALLLAAGRWAAATDLERAAALWRRVVEDHPETPYALEARRLLSGGSAADPGGEAPGAG